MIKETGMDHPGLDDVVRKYARIDRTGRRKFIERSVAPFPGQKDPERKFISALSFDEPSAELFQMRISDPLAEMGNRHGLDLTVEGRDSSIHATMLMSAFPKDTPGRDEVFSRMQADLPPTEVTQMPDGVPFNYILIDGPNVLLVAHPIPQGIKDIRAGLKEAHGKFPVEVGNYDDILHITVARLLSMPQDFDALQRYKDELIALRRNVHQSPVVLKPHRVLNGPLLDVNEIPR